MSQPPEEVRPDDVEVIAELLHIKEILEIKPSESECHEMSKQLGELAEKIDGIFKHKDDQINKLTDEFKALKEEFMKTSEKSSKKGKWFSSSSTPKKKVQILDSIESKASAKFATTLIKRMKDFDCLRKNAELARDIPLIAVCVNSTRLRSDVELALAKVNYSAKYVVIIVRTGAESNLPAISSSKKLSEFQGNVEFIDMGFDDDNGGIYKCQHNDRALECLSDYINNFV